MTLVFHDYVSTNERFHMALKQIYNLVWSGSNWSKKGLCSPNTESYNFEILFRMNCMYEKN